MPSDSTDLKALATAERDDLADLLRGLSAAQWEAPSLCADWSVREVAAHVVSYDGLGPVGLARAFARGLGRPDVVNDVVLRPLRDLAPEEVAGLVERRRRPRGLTAGFGGAIALTDGLIHHQDVRRALDLPRTVPAERLRAALGSALRAPTLPARRHARGLRLVATDLDWTAGAGREVRGPGEALLMAVAGRADALDEVSGPGAALLAERVRGR